MADLRAMQDHVQKLSQKVLPYTVAIRVGQVQGSGVIVSADGYVLTAAHVAGEAGHEAAVVTSDGRVHRARTLGQDPGSDAGLIKIVDHGEYPFAAMGDSTDVRPGQWLLATGHPGGYQETRAAPVRLGRLVRRSHAALITDCLLISGDSGGPLFDMEGRVVGVHSRIGNELDMNVHVPVNAFTGQWTLLAGETPEPAATQLASHEEGPAWLGVVADTAAVRSARIATVRPNSPAAAGGLRAGDTVTGFDGRPVESFSDLAGAVAESRPGDVVRLTVSRGGESLALSIRLARWGG